MCIAEGAHELCLYLPVYSMRVLYIYALYVHCQGAHKVRVYSLVCSMCVLHLFYVCIAGGECAFTRVCKHMCIFYVCNARGAHGFFWTLIVFVYSMCALQKVLTNCVCLLAYLVPTNCVCIYLYILCVYCRRCLGAAPVLYVCIIYAHHNKCPRTAPSCSAHTSCPNRLILIAGLTK